MHKKPTEHAKIFWMACAHEPLYIKTVLYGGYILMGELPDCAIEKQLPGDERDGVRHALLP